MAQRYTQFDGFGRADRLQMSTSVDGGLTWRRAAEDRTKSPVLGGQPVVLPNGNVDRARSQRFGDGSSRSDTARPMAGEVRRKPCTMTEDHRRARRRRRHSQGPAVSAEIDRGGKIYVVWEDCCFRGRLRNERPRLRSPSTDGDRAGRTVAADSDRRRSTAPSITSSPGWRSIENAGEQRPGRPSPTTRARRRTAPWRPAGSRRLHLLRERRGLAGARRPSWPDR